ncbi:nitrous oxide reductase family maturation protein NosD [Haladaptatus sp. YSMS36]|uniref:right-handed parallel beta-helix repeat-containing protein n=1 Tax=Haladaptatus sp. YSMS36 TaxID=3033384 RepID=UPI0023E8513E|nr:NosD domain-containing protein [Haladaptatus sp. YSMS36]
MSTQTAVFGTLLVLLSTTAGGTVVGGAQSDVVELNSCQVISESGTYHLTQNISNEGRDACLRITASDVTVDGNGFTIDGPAQGPAILVTGTETLSDVSLSNLAVQRRSGGVQLKGVSGGTVENLDLRDGDVSGALLLENSTDITVADTDISRSLYGIVLRNADGNTLVGNDFGTSYTAQETLIIDDSSRNVVQNNRFVEGTVDIRPDAPDNTFVGNEFMTTDETYESTALLVRSSDNVIRDNTLKNVQTGIAVSGENNLVHGNHVIGATDFAIDVNAGGQRIENNTLVGNGEGIQMAGGGIQLETGDHIVVGNKLADNVHGIQLRTVTGGVTIERNRIAGNNIGIEIHNTALCGAGGEGAELVSVHQNDIVENHAFGIANHDDDFVDAMGNYWGASDGASSPEDASDTLTDPVSEEKADGYGDAVTGRTVSNTSSVHFDGWLESPVFNATA